MANLEQVEEAPKHVEMSTQNFDSSQKPQYGHPGGAREPVACLIPTYKDACQLVSAPYSCLVMHTHRRHIALAPMFLKKKRTGIQDELNTELLRYSESLQGVPLAYDNIRILGQVGQINDDSAYIHLDIEASFVIFRPQKGQKVVGVVNKLSMQHVGCVIHGCFNGSVPKPQLVSVETWRDAGPRIGAELEFEVFQLDADVAGVLLIRGRLSRTHVQELMAMSDSASHSIPAVQQEEPGIEPPTPEPPTPEPLEASAEPAWDASPSTPTPPSPATPASTPTPRKKKKKDKHREEEPTVSSLTLPPGGVVPQEMNGTPDERKKKKDKRREENPAIPSLTLPAVGGAVLPELNGTPDIRKKKDRHREEEPTVSSLTLPAGGVVLQELNGTPDERKKKKKKDKHREEEMPTVSSLTLQAMDIGISGHMEEKKKKKKKDKRVEVVVKEEETFEPILTPVTTFSPVVTPVTTFSPVVTPGSDSSGYLSDKSHKKRKQVVGDDITSCFDQEPEQPKSKRKKK